MRFNHPICGLTIPCSIALTYFYVAYIIRDGEKTSTPPHSYPNLNFSFLILKTRVELIALEVNLNDYRKGETVVPPETLTTEKTLSLQLMNSIVYLFISLSGFY